MTGAMLHRLSAVALVALFGAGLSAVVAATVTAQSSSASVDIIARPKPT